MHTLGWQKYIYAILKLIRSAKKKFTPTLSKIGEPLEVSHSRFMKNCTFWHILLEDLS